MPAGFESLATPTDVPLQPWSGAVPAVWPGPAPPGPGRVQQPPAPKFRAQMPDEPSSARAAPAEKRLNPLSMPTPEELGLTPMLPSLKLGEARAGTAEANSTDWTAAHRRLDRLGACSFHMEKLPQGGCRFSCLLPTARPQRFHRVESQAPTEAEAVRLVLDRAEAWAGGK